MLVLPKFLSNSSSFSERLVETLVDTGRIKELLST